jgi:hypothetical protein
MKKEKLVDTKYGFIGDLVEIKWRDSNMHITQCNQEDEFKVAVITSIGQLVKIQDDAVVLAGDILDDGEIRRVIVIPEENIISF